MIDGWKNELWRAIFKKKSFVGQMPYKFLNALFHQSIFVGPLPYKIIFRKINLL